jgi:hypothetical protein
MPVEEYAVGRSTALWQQPRSVRDWVAVFVTSSSFLFSMRMMNSSRTGVRTRP